MNSFMKKKISLEDMYLYELLTTTGSISGVANRTGLTQPAVTQKLNRLEKQIGASLWIRRGRSLGEPSDVGKRFLHYSKTVLRETMDLFTDLGIMTQDRIIHIGCSSIPSEHFVPRLISSYRGASSNEEMRLSLAGSRKICMLLENNTIDAGFTGYIMPGYTGKSHAIAEDEIVPIISRNSTIAKADKPLTLKELMKKTLIVREADSGTRSVLEETLERCNVKMPTQKNVIEVGGTHALVQAVHEGMGFSFVSSLHQHDLYRIKLKDFPIIRRKFFLLYRNDSILDRKINRFIQFVIDHFNYNP